MKKNKIINVLACAAIFSYLMLIGCQTQKPIIQNTQTAQIINEAKVAYGKNNFKKAKLLLLPLAEKGDALAQYEVGYLYYYGLGTSINHKKAKGWIRLAASNGYQPAIKALKILS